MNDSNSNITQNQEKINDMKKNVKEELTIDGSTSLVIFIILTTVYFIAKYFLTKKSIYPLTEKGNTMEYILLGVYLISILTTQLYANISNVYRLCKNNKNNLYTIYLTLAPNILIFGLLIILIKKFPGWLSPFSDTIGFLIVSFFSKNVISNIFYNSKNIDQSNMSDYEKQKLKIETSYLDKINRDDAMLVNELTSDIGNFNTFINNLSNNIKKPNHQEHLPALYNLIVMKDLIAEWGWYMLLGILVNTITFNSLMNIKCGNVSLKKVNTGVFDEDEE